MKEQLFSNCASSEYPNFKDITRRYQALCQQHAALTEKLREVYDNPEIQTTAPIKWHEIENQAVSLRFEIESFKQIF